MRLLALTAFLTVLLAGCSFPAPYQTYSPTAVTAPVLNSNALVVYGETTTTPDMVPDAVTIQPLPTPAAPGSAPKEQSVSICYNRIWNKPDAITTAATQACGRPSLSPRVVSQGIDLNACPLLTPTKAVFACTAAASP